MKNLIFRNSYVLIFWGVLFFGACAHPPKTVTPTNNTPVFKTLWNAQTRTTDYLGKYTIEHAKPSHSKSTDQLIIASSTGYVTAFLAGNGKEEWRKKFKESFFAGPLSVSQTLYLASLEGVVRSLEIRNGDVIWEKNLGVSIETMPAYYDGRIFVSDTNNGLYALDASTGEMLWSYRRDPPSFFTIRGSCKPVIDKDAVYCGFTDGYLGAFQIDTGEMLWSTNLSDGQTEFTDIVEDVFIDGERLYTASYGGGVYALDRAEGGVIWHNKVRGVGSISESENAIVFTTSTRRVASIDKETGDATWSFKFKKNAPIDVITVGEYVFVTTASGPVYLLELNTGYPFEKWIGTHGTSAAPTWGGNRLYFFTDKGEVVAAQLGW